MASIDKMLKRIIEDLKLIDRKFRKLRFKMPLPVIVKTNSSTRNNIKSFTQS